MGTITNLTATAAATQGAKVAATGTPTQAEKDSATNAFELLMRNMSARFKGTASPLDANIVRDPANRPEPKQAEPRDDRRVEKNDKTDAKTDKAADRKDANDAKDDAADADAANDQAADAGDAQEATQTVQMAALQAQLMSTTTITPVAVVAQTVTEGPVFEAQLADNTQIVQADPTAQVAAVATVTATQQAAAAPVVAQQIAQAVTDDDSDAPVVAQTEEVVDTNAETVVADKVVKAQGPVQTVAGPQTEQIEDDAPKADADGEAKTQQTPAAKAQSDALSRLLGNSDQIKVAVTVEQPKAATPSINPYNHFTGYSMAANAGGSLANGGHNQAEATNALVADDTATPQPQVAAVAVAPTTAMTAPAPVAATADTGVSAISSTSASQGSAHSQADAGQSGLGQSNLNNANGTNEANGTKNTEGAKQPTPSQVFEQIKVHITRATKAGLDHVTIQLRPDDLGRIEVKLEMAHDGKVKAMVIADNPQTLQLMQQDSHGLERALTDAGLRTDANTLEFSLRGDSNTGLAKSEGGNAAGGNGGTEADATEDQSFDYGRAAYLRGGIDTYA